MSQAAWKRLDRSIKACELCERLRSHCQQIATVKRRAFLNEKYWGRPVPNFGDATANLLVVGLAPAAHGANRTGRMFTGDRSGDWLFRAMHRFGFASQPHATGRRDGLKLHDAAITAIAHCAPPDNKPTPAELLQCQPFLHETFRLSDPLAIVALGGLAWNATLAELAALNWFDIPRPKPKFGHATILDLPNNRRLIGSYHPSQQNTFTGRLTEAMLDQVFAEARHWIDTNSNTH